MTTQAQIEALEARADQILNQYLGDGNWISPYQLAHAVSELCGRYVREQLVYNYITKAPRPYIPASKGATGKWQVNRTDALAWMVRFASK
jgi:hypothetical protein